MRIKFYHDFCVRSILLCFTRLRALDEQVPVQLAKLSGFRALLSCVRNSDSRFRLFVCSRPVQIISIPKGDVI